MTQYGIGYTPDVSDDLDFETPNKTSLLSGAYDAAKLSFKNSPTANEQSIYATITQAVEDPGKFLTENDWKSSQYYREGLSFPHGVSENVARLAANKFDSNASLEEHLSNMDSGLLPWTAKTIGTGVGFAIDPTNLATTLLVPELIGDQAAKTALSLSAEGTYASKAAYISSQMVKGSAEGGLVMLPNAVSDEDVKPFVGQTPDALNELVNIGDGALLGGIIRGVGGTYRIISKDAFNMAKQAAATQAATDRNIDVTDIAQAGYNEARAVKTPPAEGPIADLFETNNENIEKMRSENPDLSDNDIVNNLDAETLLKDNPRVDLDSNEVQNNIESMNDFNNDSAMDLDENRAFQERIDSIEGDGQLTDADIRDRLDYLKENKLLSDEDINDLNDLDESESQWGKVADALRSFTDCILGGEGE